jgi:hypothetical protein
MNSTTIPSLFSDFVTKEDFHFKGFYRHSGVDLPTSGNTGFNLIGEAPKLIGHMDQFSDENGQWYEEFVGTHYELKVSPQLCGDEVMSLYGEIQKARLEEFGCQGTYGNCKLIVLNTHPWSLCIKDTFNLDEQFVIQLVVEGYNVINRPDLMPVGVIVRNSVMKAIRKIGNESHYDDEIVDYEDDEIIDYKV